MLAIETKAQMLSVNTEATTLALMAPNLGLELTVGEKSTVGLNFITAQNSWGKSVEAYVIQPEYRYYVKGRPMYSLFVGVAGIATSYNFPLDNKVYDGYAVGAGLSFGYVLPLSERWNIDFHAGYGAILYRQREYGTTDNYDSDSVKNGEAYVNASGCWFLPTKFGVSVSYIIR